MRGLKYFSNMSWGKLFLRIIDEYNLGCGEWVGGENGNKIVI